MRLVKDYNGQEFVLEEGFWTGKKKLYVDGEEAQCKNKKSFVLNEETITLKGNFLTGASINYKNEEIVLCKNAWYEWILIFLPFANFLVGVFFGAVGGFLSALASICCAVTNAYILRSKGNLVVKVFLCLILFIVFSALWFLIVLYIAQLITK